MNKSSTKTSFLAPSLNFSRPPLFQKEEPNKETLKAMLEVKNNINLSPPFNSIDELMEDLNA